LIVEGTRRRWKRSLRQAQKRGQRQTRPLETLYIGRGDALRQKGKKEFIICQENNPRTHRLGVLKKGGILKARIRIKRGVIHSTRGEAKAVTAGERGPGQPKKCSPRLTEARSWNEGGPFQHSQEKEPTALLTRIARRRRARGGRGNEDSCFPTLAKYESQPTHQLNGGLQGGA